MTPCAPLPSFVTNRNNFRKLFPNFKNLLFFFERTWNKFDGAVFIYTTVNSRRADLEVIVSLYCAYTRSPYTRAAAALQHDVVKRRLTARQASAPAPQWHYGDGALWLWIWRCGDTSGSSLRFIHIGMIGCGALRCGIVWHVCIIRQDAAAQRNATHSVWTNVYPERAERAGDHGAKRKPWVHITYQWSV